MPYQPDQNAHGQLSIPHSQISRWASILIMLGTLAVVFTACGPASQSVATLNTPANSQHDFTYVAIGASDAFGVGTDDPAHDNWPTALAHLMGSDVHLINLGIPGETVAEARQTELPVALDAKPALITVWLGVNDIVQSVSVQNYEQQLEALLRSLQQRTHAHVFVANIPDLSLLSFFAGYDQGTLQTLITHWNAAIARAVSATGAFLVDLFSSWNELANHPEYIAGDGLHPSTEGAKRLAEVFYSRIRPALPAIRSTVASP